MQTQTQIPNQIQTTNMEIKLPLEKAIEFRLLRDDIRNMLTEFYEWYNWRYVMPVEVELGMDYIKMYMECDVSEELDKCIDLCVENVNKDTLAEELTKEEINAGCYETCNEDISMDTNGVFSEIRRKLWEILDKYGFKYDWEDSWEGDIKYLRFKIEF